MLTGTWCTPEIKETLNKGYTLNRIHEVWHFQRKKKGLFKDYVNTWLKIKPEASGRPRENMTDEEKNQYIDEYFQHEGIRLEKENREFNP